MNKFGRRLRAARLAADLNQENVAKLTGIGRSTLSKYESGVNEPTLGALIKLSGAFGVTIDELVKENHDLGDEVINSSNAGILHGLDKRYLNAILTANEIGISADKLMNIIKAVSN